MNNVAETEIFDLGFDRISKMKNQIELNDMKYNRRKKMKKFLGSALEAAEDLDNLENSLELQALLLP